MSHFRESSLRPQEARLTHAEEIHVPLTQRVYGPYLPGRNSIIQIRCYINIQELF